MSKADRDLLVACFVMALAIFTIYASATMATPRELIESPGLFPGLMGIVLFIFGVELFHQIDQDGEAESG